MVSLHSLSEVQLRRIPSQMEKGSGRAVPEKSRDCSVPQGIKGDEGMSKILDDKSLGKVDGVATTKKFFQRRD